MGYTILSLIIFAISLYIFYITNKKVQSIKDETISSEIRQEMESLITEFNLTAARNVELLENKIEELEKYIGKADKRLINLDDKISRAKRPIVVEKIVEKEVRKEKISHSVPDKSPQDTVSGFRFVEKPAEKKTGQKGKKKLSRSDELKELLGQGKSEQELIAMGYQSSEIKLLRLIIK